jgi:hypothetical protein
MGTSVASVRAASVFQHLGGPIILDIRVSKGRQSVISQKRRGPPATGKGVPILVRIHPPLLRSLDEWIGDQDVSFTRPEAIRRLIEIGLDAKSKRQITRGEKK